MPSDDAERSIYEAAKSGLKAWLGRAKEAVMAPWKRFRAQPNPEEIYRTVPAWQAQVDKIIQALTPALREGWAAADLPGDFDINNPYIQANLALTYNLLVRIPDEVHAMVVAQILEGVQASETTDQIAQRIDNVLTFTNSETWDNRAKLIAVTELTRHFGSSILAHALLRQQQGQQNLRKQWDTRMDGKERPAHHEANDDIQELGQPFLVGGELLLFPAAPNGSPNNVCGCRCGLRILEGAA